MEPENQTIGERLAAMNVKLDLLLANEADKEARLRTLERRDAYVLGASAVLSVIVTLALKRFGY